MGGFNKAKKVILQYSSNKYTITIPRWIVKEILEAEKGDVIKFDVIDDKVVIKKGVHNNNG